MLNDDELPAAMFGSSTWTRVLTIELLDELASDLISTLPIQFLKFPEENSAMPTYVYPLVFEHFSNQKVILTIHNNIISMLVDIDISSTIILTCCMAVIFIFLTPWPLP